jgi:hypothetical protein
MITKRIFLTLIVTGVTAILVTVMVARASLSRASQAGQHLEGSWSVDGTSQAVPPFKDLWTFTLDGGFLTSDTIANTPVGIELFSTGHGEWIRTGNREFAVTFVLNRYSLEGTFKGSFKTWMTVRLNETLDRLEGSFRRDVIDPAGTVVFSFTAMLQATRIEVEPPE